MLRKGFGLGLEASVGPKLPIDSAGVLCATKESVMDLRYVYSSTLSQIFPRIMSARILKRRDSHEVPIPHGQVVSGSSRLRSTTIDPNALTIGGKPSRL